MEAFAQSVTPNQGEKTDKKKVKFCDHLGKDNECKLCENNFEGKRTLSTTTVHQVKKDIVSYVTENRDDMIVDIGCPNSVISSKDVSNFVKNLSIFQQKNIEMVPADDKFKFGPSGPFRCSEKLKFPIEVDSELFWVEVALVEANIPMLLGNNILKPLGALIKLFTSGNGVLVLNEVEIPMKETTGGHFIVKITDLGKLCDKFNEISIFCAMKEHKCNKCDEIFDSRRVLENHLITKHGAKDSHCKSGNSRPALKNKQINSIVQNKSCLHEVETDLNTLQNGARSKREHRMIQVMKKFALQVKQEGLDFECDVCDANSGNRKDHRVENVQETKELKCKDCGKWFEEQNKTHEKEVKSNYKCDQCVKYYMDKDNLSSHKIDEHDLNIFMVHHVEEDDDCEF